MTVSTDSGQLTNLRVIDTGVVSYLCRNIVNKRYVSVGMEINYQIEYGAINLNMVKNNCVNRFHFNLKSKRSNSGSSSSYISLYSVIQINRVYYNFKLNSGFHCLLFHQKCYNCNSSLSSVFRAAITVTQFQRNRYEESKLKFLWSNRLNSYLYQ